MPCTRASCHAKAPPLFRKKGRVFILSEQAVSRVLSADRSAVWPSILAHRHRCARAITESLTGSHFCGKAASALIPILHRVGFTGRSSRQAAGELLPRLSILTRADAGGIFLLHFPWSRLRRTLSGTLPCGARTFLMRTSRTQPPGLLVKIKTVYQQQTLDKTS